LAERASTLVVDVLNALYDELYSVALTAIDNALHPEQITLRLDDLSAAIQSVRISGDVEEEVQENSRSSDQLAVNARASVDGKPAVEIHGGRSTARSTTGSQRVLCHE
jgi:hypothetical protein